MLFFFFILCLAGFLKTLQPNGSFSVQQFFFPPVSNVAIIKTKSATIAFFSSPPFFLLALFLFLLSFSFVSVILEFIGPKKLPFDAFSFRWLQILLGWFSKNRLDVKTSAGHAVRSQDGRSIFELPLLTLMSRFSTVKYLGVLLDSNLSWKFQINNVALKISRTVGVSSKFDCNIHSVRLYIL